MEAPKEMQELAEALGMKAEDLIPLSGLEGAYRLGDMFITPKDATSEEIERAMRADILGPQRETHDPFNVRSFLGKVIDKMDILLNGMDMVIPEKKAQVDTADNGFHLRQHGLRIMHFNNPVRNTGGMTVAYKLPEDYAGKDGHSTMEVATAICHPQDTFNKKLGTRLAVSNFLDGKRVTLPILAHDVSSSLKAMFGHVIYR